MTQGMPEISVVLPVYKNRAMLIELHRRLCETLDGLDSCYEIIFVNDACPENSLCVLGEIARSDVRVAVIALARNFGQYRALLAGLTYSRGSIVLVMDADLQDPPEAIPALIEKLREGFGAVYAGRRGRYQSGMRLFTSQLFKGLIAVLTGMPADAGLFVAMTRETVERLVAFDEPNPYLTAMIACVGRPLASIPVLRAERPEGESAYSSWMRLKIGLRAMVRALHWRYRPRFATTSTMKTEIREQIGARFADSVGSRNKL